MNCNKGPYKGLSIVQETLIINLIKYIGINDIWLVNGSIGRTTNIFHSKCLPQKVESSDLKTSFSHSMSPTHHKDLMVKRGEWSVYDPCHMPKY